MATDPGYVPAQPEPWELEVKRRIAELEARASPVRRIVPACAEHVGRLVMEAFA